MGQFFVMTTNIAHIVEDDTKPDVEEQSILLQRAQTDFRNLHHDAVSFKFGKIKCIFSFYLYKMCLN